MAAARLNWHAISQRYAVHMQELANKVSDTQLRPANIEDTIRQVFGFEEGPLWDSPANIRRINAIQNDYAVRDQN